MPAPRFSFFVMVSSLVLPLEARAEAPAEKTLAARAPTESTYPWKLDQEHRFLWLLKQEKVGETRFVARLVPYPGRPGEQLLELRATRGYHRMGVVQQATGTTHVSLAGDPRRYDEKLTVLHATTARRSLQETSLERRGEIARVSFVQNGHKDRARVDERTLEEGTFLCASQAVEHWAAFVALLPKSFTSHELKLYYPGQRKVFTVRLKSRGEESVKVGKRSIAARRYTAQSERGEIDAGIWIAEDGRLVQIVFPATDLRVVLAE